VRNQGAALVNLEKPPVDFIAKSSQAANRFDGMENENPGALAGATGAGQDMFGNMSASYRMRAERATSLCLSIADCDPQDAVQIMAAALEDMTQGGPRVPFLEDMRDAAESWAALAPPHELEAYALSALPRLGQSAIGLTMRKRIFAALWKSFSSDDRNAFARKVGLVRGDA